MRQNAMEFDEAEGPQHEGLSFRDFCELTREREDGEFTDEELRARFLALDVHGHGRIAKVT